ncbi:kinase-like protein [Annulohypoxylon maeteangense]|uniref:kinase-like protein n=1 Tax=Annulohypoxylon maeteangense TaxID=1927788 RepID=UPI002008BB43|nr:kinase-like protein [Annulohypoxylon maeteangense]KAI0886486.1 kinase-like protein [Annulohypoxylon maeteangense]
MAHREEGTGSTSQNRNPGENYTSKITNAFRAVKVSEATIAKTLERGFSDFCIPMPTNSIPNDLSPSAFHSYWEIQPQLLEDTFKVGSRKEPPVHFNLREDAIGEYTNVPKVFGDDGTTIGRSNNTDVIRVKYGDDVYALKRIQRVSHGTTQAIVEQMNYIKGELSIMRKIHHNNFRHFVKLIASYTTEGYVGMLLSPSADYNLAEYLDFVHTNQTPPNMIDLRGFFGCLITALAHLHYVEQIRHKDIKPKNILVRGKTVLLADFGISLDWGATGCTTTITEKMKSPKYCAPEVDQFEPRNSMSDIWSLGCVFLEMFAVLKNKDIAYVDTLLARCSTEKFCAKPETTRIIIADLEAGDPQHGNEPVAWIKKMLQWSKKDRPTARAVREEIFEKYDYCGLCCRQDWIFNENISQGKKARYVITAKILQGYDLEPRWKEVEVMHNPRISKCWISPDALQGSHLQPETKGAESMVLDGKVFQSDQFVKITCKVGEEMPTILEEFCVAKEIIPFNILVDTSTFDKMRSMPEQLRGWR